LTECKYRKGPGNLLTENYRNALTYALDAHKNHVRKGSGVPYFSHVVAVSSLVIEYGGDEDEAIAALLHDVLEDCGAHFAYPIQMIFGNDVLQMVQDCSDFVGRKEDKPDWKPRKTAYLKSLAGKSPRSLLVSCCDKLHNARAIERDLRLKGEAVWTRFTHGRKCNGWYYQNLADKFIELDSPPSPELKKVVDRIFQSR
jgi:GTP pyrophosphokinase